MTRGTALAANVRTILGASLLIAILGYAYVNIMGMGWRPILIIHGGAIFFLGCALFLRDLRSFLVFVMVFAISLQFHYYIYYQPLTGIESQPFISGITIDVVDLLLLLLYAQWALKISVRKSTTGVTLGAPVGAILVLWIAVCLLNSLLKSKELSYSLFEVVVLFKGFLLYLYIVNNTETVRDLQVLIYALFVSSVVHGIYIAAQYVSGMNYTLHGELVRGYRGGYEAFRAVGFFGSWDAASAMCALVFPLFLTYFITVKGRLRRLAALLGMLVVLIGLLCLKVRAGYIAVAVSFFTVMVLSLVRYRVPVVRLQRMVIASLVGIVIIVPVVAHRFIAGTWGQERWPLIETAWAMIKANWVLGVGLNNYPFNIREFVPPYLRGQWAYTVHNEFLLRFAETGVIGGVLYYSMIGIIMVKLWRSARSSDPWIHLVSLGLFAAMVGSIAPRFVSFYHYLNLFLQLSVLLAIAQILGNLEAKGLATERAATQQGELSPESRES
jgi:hypothetical protein